MTTIPATRAFSIQTICGGGWSRIFCLLGMLCVSDMAVAARSGRVVSYSIPAWICPGESLPISVTVQNTGDVTWEGYWNSNSGNGQYSCGIKLAPISWASGFDFHVWEHYGDVTPGESLTFNDELRSQYLPSSPGLHTFRLTGYCWTSIYPNEQVLNNSPTVSFRIIAPVSWFDGSTSMADGWRWLGWLGMFYGPTGGWVFHPEHGWLYAVGTSPADVWFWDDQLGWFWTSHLIYPDIYVSDQQRWFCYAKGSTSPRWFYRYGFLDGVAMEWIDGDWVFYGGFTGTGFLAD